MFFAQGFYFLWNILSPGLKKNNIQSRGEPFGILVVVESRGEPFGQNVLLELLFKVGANHSEFRMVRPRTPIFWFTDSFYRARASPVNLVQRFEIFANLWKKVHRFAKKLNLWTRFILPFMIFFSFEDSPPKKLWKNYEKNK